MLRCFQPVYSELLQKIVTDLKWSDMSEFVLAVDIYVNQSWLH
jgi:hypothetical protein